MLIHKLSPLFYTENEHLVEVLDRRDGKWIGEKERGYGILLIPHNALRFGIPLRSNAHPKFGFITKANKGLDYRKAVLLMKDEHISDSTFRIPDDEYLKIKDNAHRINIQFSKFVDRYVAGVRRDDRNILRQYGFSTLQNYHPELGL